MERQWTITHLSVHDDGEMCSYLEALVDTEAKAKELMEDIYDDAEHKYTTKIGVIYSDPKWLDDEHTKLEVKASIRAGYTTLSYTETYFLSWISSEEKVRNPKWILE